MRADSHAGLRYCCPILTYVRICRLFFFLTSQHYMPLKGIQRFSSDSTGIRRKRHHQLANRRTSASTSCRCERTKWHRAQEPLNIHSSGMLNAVSGKEFPTSRIIVAPSSSGSSTPKKCYSTCCIPLLFTKYMTINKLISCTFFHQNAEVSGTREVGFYFTICSM